MSRTIGSQDLQEFVQSGRLRDVAKDAPVSTDGHLLPIDRVSIWFCQDGALRWFGFVARRDGVFIAKRLKVMFGVSAIVAPYLFEPAAWQRPLTGKASR